MRRFLILIQYKHAATAKSSVVRESSPFRDGIFVAKGPKVGPPTGPILVLAYRESSETRKDGKDATMASAFAVSQVRPPESGDS
jgi:hypothetical protein